MSVCVRKINRNWFRVVFGMGFSGAFLNLWKNIRSRFVIWLYNCRIYSNFLWCHMLPSSRLLKPRKYFHWKNYTFLNQCPHHIYHVQSSYMFFTLKIVLFFLLFFCHYIERIWHYVERNKVIFVQYIIHTYSSKFSII